MKKMKNWKIRRQDLENVRKHFKNMRNQDKERKYCFTFSLEDPDFCNEESHIYFVGKNEKNILGYAICYLTQPGTNIGAISKIFESGDSEDLVDFGGKVVSREILKNYDGYENYLCKGQVCYIGLMEVFLHRRGIGSNLLNYVKSTPNLELIDLRANGYDEAIFFRKNGFIDSGIDAETGSQIVMVWNNPKYK
jgi:hypothetical protein